MKTLTKLALTLIAVAGLQACDPYDDENSGPPSVAGALATDGGAAVEGTATGTSWTIAGAPSGTVIFVKANAGKLLDGASIQTSDSDCTPANGWLSVNGAGPGNWMSCYYPQSPASFEGASVVLYPGPSITDLDSWFGLTELAPGIFNLAGTVSDKQGHPLAIDVNVFVADVLVAPDATGTELTVTFSDTGDNMTNVQLWETTADADGNPVEAGWTAVATTSPYVHSGLVPETTLWYKLTATTGGYPGTAVDYEMATPVSGTTVAP